MTLKGVFKFCLYALIFVLPVLVLFVIFAPLAAKKNPQRTAAEYQIPPDFTINDIAKIVERMRTDPEFQFYFRALSSDKITQGALEVYEIMNRSRSGDVFLNEIKLQQKKTSSLALLFYYLEYSDDFFKNPELYPDLSKTIVNFSFEDFKLAVLSICYKSNIDPTFFLKWDETSQLAARKLFETIKRLNK
ncbi:MAG: hypothetical protein KBD53_04170 [Candidatus Omnitrophica bacterium]|nr:hypothetical protein [Candidatus Omnitrophota bacterium]